MSLARVEMVCGGASASVDSDLSGYFRLDVDTLGFVMPTASQGRIFDSMHSDPLSESRPMRGFCELKIVASGFREKMLVTDMYPEGQMGTIILQPIRNPVQWSISTNTLLAPRSAVAKFEKARRFAGKKQFERAEEELKKAVAEYETLRLGLGRTWLHAIARIASCRSDGKLSNGVACWGEDSGLVLRLGKSMRTGWAAGGIREMGQDGIDAARRAGRSSIQGPLASCIRQPNPTGAS